MSESIPHGQKSEIGQNGEIIKAPVWSVSQGAHLYSITTPDKPAQIIGESPTSFRLVEIKQEIKDGRFVVTGIPLLSEKQKKQFSPLLFGQVTVIRRAKG